MALGWRSLRLHALAIARVQRGRRHFYRSRWGAAPAVPDPPIANAPALAAGA